MTHDSNLGRGNRVKSSAGEPLERLDADETNSNNGLTCVLAMTTIPHICAWCLDVKNPVDGHNGHSVRFGEAGQVEIEFYLHYRCAHPWSQDFAIALPPEFRLTYANYN
jgi:hypothetical protein